MSEERRQRGYALIPEIKQSVDAFHGFLDAAGAGPEGHAHVQTTKTKIDEFYEVLDGMIICPGQTPNPSPLYAPIGSPFIDENFAVLDPALWRSEFPWGRDLTINNELQHYVAALEGQTDVASPFTTGPDGLKITSRREQYEDHEWVSGKLCTTAANYLDGEFYVEAKVKGDIAPGVWPAFWLYTAQFGGDEPEIDIFEQPSLDPSVVYHNYHFRAADGTVAPSQVSTTVVDSTEWHTYGAKRVAGCITYFVDRLPVHKVTDNVTLQPMNMILNLAMGGNWPGPVDPSIDSAEFCVEYVKAWSAA